MILIGLRLRRFIVSKVYEDYLYWEEIESCSRIDEVLLEQAECLQDLVRACEEVKSE